MESSTDSSLWIIGSIILSAGFMGGLANYHRLESNATFNWFNFRRSIFTGIVAAATVPLFLKMLSSKLLEDAAKEGGEYVLNYFVFGGFCLVAAFFSHRFLETIGDKVLKELEEVKSKTEALEEETAENKEMVGELVEGVSEEDEIAEEANEKLVDRSLTDEVRRSGEPIVLEVPKMEGVEILEAINNSDYRFRTLNGLAKELGQEKLELEQNLERMKSQDMIRQYHKRSGKPIYTLTKKGKMASIKK